MHRLLFFLRPRNLFAIAASALCFSASAQQVITTIAGTGAFGYTGDGGPAKQARLSFPVAVADDSHDNLYIADYDALVVRMIDAAGIIHTIAGNHDTGYNGDGGPATAAKLGGADGVAVDNAGNIYVCAMSYHTIRKIDPSGTITTFAGIPGVSGFSGDGGAATAAALGMPVGITTDNSGNVYFSDRYNMVIRRITPSGIISTVAGIPDSSGYTGTGGPATAAKIGDVFAMCSDPAGNLYIGESYPQHIIRKIDAGGIITLVAGDDSATYTGDGMAATATKIGGAQGLTTDGDGNVYFSEGGTVRKINTSGILSTVAGNGHSGFGGDGGNPVYATIRTYGICINNHGELLMADGENARVRKVADKNTLDVGDSDDTNWSLFPNPCGREVHLTGPSTGSYKVSLTNILGQQLFETTMQAEQNNITTLSLPALAKGTYQLHVAGIGSYASHALTIE